MGTSEIVYAAVVAAVLLVIVVAVNRGSRPSTLGPPAPPTMLDAAAIQQISDLLTAGKQIEAIKRYREATGVGLAQAKDAIDAWDPRRHMGSPAAPSASAGDDLAVGARAVKQTSGDVHAIRFVREQTGWGLAEAKGYVDRLS